MTASRIIGTPHRIIAIHAMSNDNDTRLKMLHINATADMTSRAMSFLAPPVSMIFSIFPINAFKSYIPFHTHRGIGALYLWGYRLVKVQKKKPYFHQA
jgi:hypothetical protein